jgi:hypothetical protein
MVSRTIRCFIAALLLCLPSLAWAQPVPAPGCPTIGCIPAPETPTDHSGTIAIGGQAQQLFAANVTRKGCSFQNLSSDNLYLNDTSSASAGAGSLLVTPGSYWNCAIGGVVTNGAISLYGATTGDQFTAKEYN